MRVPKKFLFPTLLLFFSILAFGCQSENSQESAPTDPPVEEKPADAAETGPQPVDISEITNIKWQWAELIENEPAAQSVVADPENYTVTFWDDGNFSFKADCNSGGGTYTVDGSKIEFGPMMSTMAMCPSESLHDQFIALLGQIDSFGLADDKLVFSLKDSAGEMRFENGGLAEKPETETPAPAPEIKTLFIGPEKVECVGVGPMECYQVKEDPNADWQLFYDQIEGFEWEPGYTYELRVAVHPVEDPPADASSLRYELVEVINQVETPVESGKASSHITIEFPAPGMELDASKPIKVRGMGAGLFEGNVVVQILDEDGNELALQPTTLQSPEAGMGGEGPWETEISIAIDGLTEVRIVAFSPSPKDDEGWLASDEVDVTLNLGTKADIGLENTSWILRSFEQQDDLNPLLAVHQVTAFFNADDNKLNGVAGCNNYFTSYEVEGAQLRINIPIGTTRMMCPESQMVLESTYLAALENMTSFEIDSNTLEIMDEGGNPLLVFQVDPFSLSDTFTREELANTSYLNEFAPSGVVQLVDGVYRESETALGVTVLLTNHAVFGDVTDDGVEEALVVLVSVTDGSGSFYDLAVVRKQDAALTNMARIQLGDRVQIENMYIDNGEIVVDMLTQGPDDPMCCPTQYVRNHYAIESGELVLIRSEAVE